MVVSKDDSMCYSGNLCRYLTCRKFFDDYSWLSLVFSAIGLGIKSITVALVVFLIPSTCKNGKVYKMQSLIQTSVLCCPHENIIHMLLVVCPPIQTFVLCLPCRGNFSFEPLWTATTKFTSPSIPHMCHKQPSANTFTCFYFLDNHPDIQVISLNTLFNQI